MYVSNIIPRRRKRKNDLLSSSRINKTVENKKRSIEESVTIYKTEKNGIYYIISYISIAKECLPSKEKTNRGPNQQYKVQ